MQNNEFRNAAQRQGPLFTRPIAAQLARVSMDFLEMLEEERLIRPRTTAQGEKGYSAEDITQIVRIRRLHEDLGLDLEAVEIVLHMRRQIVDLLQRMEEMERRLAQRESDLLAEIQELRRRLGVKVER
ncbi:MAG: chaperone modulator CbpM [Deltaproteobacteria bacterium]|nr:chaperone modulator CbpM [Deltaproteobacteria bacterium]